MKKHKLFNRTLLGLLVLHLAGVVSSCDSESSPVPADDPPVGVDAEGAAVVQVASGEVRVHVLQLGTVAVKRCHQELCQPESTTLLERLVEMLKDTEFEPPMPILAYVIEHPDGIFVVDTGELTRFNDDPEYYACDPGDGQIDRNLLRVDVEQQDEIGPQLERIGIDPLSVQAVVLTHLHADHTGGVPYFAGVPVYVSKADFELGANGGFVTCRSLAEADVRYFEELDAADGDALAAVFGPSAALTSDGAIRLVPTPGHTAGSRSLMVDGLEVDLLFFGDASFTEQMVTDGELAGIDADLQRARQTYDQVKQWAAEQPTVVLPAHDWDAPARLRAGTTPPFGAPLP